MYTVGTRMLFVTGCFLMLALDYFLHKGIFNSLRPLSIGDIIMTVEEVGNVSPQTYRFS